MSAGSCLLGHVCWVMFAGSCLLGHVCWAKFSGTILLGQDMGGSESKNSKVNLDKVLVN